MNRLFKHVVSRKTKKVPELQAGDPIYRLSRPVDEAPPYPYGEATLYKQSNKGLYGGKMIQFGNKISEHKNRNVRTFKPNVNWQKLWSEALKRPVQIKVVGSVLKTITKEGGLDNYLIKDKAARIKELGPAGWKLRYEVLKRLEAQKLARPEVVDHLDSEDGHKVPVFAQYTSKDGQSIPIVSGRNKLLLKLYEVDGKTQYGSFTSFRSAHRDLSIDQVLAKLELSGVDIASLKTETVL